MIFLIQIIKERLLLLFAILTNTLIIFFSGFCIAETYTLTIKVDVIESTCDVYGENGPGQPIEVSFGEMNLNKFTSERYTKNIDYHLDCGNKSSSNPNLKLKLESSSAGFNTDLVETSNPNLGLKIQADNTLLLPNEYRNFTYQTQPVLTATPVFHEGKEIELGLFKATGILKVEYQ